MSATLPDKDFSAEAVPVEHRGWYVVVLLRPLNELRRALVAALNRGLGISNFNMQLLGPKRITSDATGAIPVQTFASTLAGRCVGIQVLRVAELDSSGQETVNVLGAWALPTWEEKDGKFRIVSQTGPAASKAYNVTWQAWGR